MSDSVHVRRATVADFPALLELINLAFFKSEDRRFETALPHLYADPAVATEQAYLAEIDGKLVGHVGVYPLRLNCGGVELSAGGIGAVGCHPDYRGHGVMSRLLPVAIRGMEEAGYDISVLWGARTRYRRYGWDLCGKRLEWYLDMKSPALAGVPPIAMRPADPQRDLATLTRLWNSDSVGTIQTEQTMSRLLLRDWHFALTPDGRALAVYEIEADRLAVDKLIGPSEQLPGLLAWLRQQIKTPKAFVLVRCPTGDHPLARLAVDVGENPSQHACGQIRIVRPQQLADKLNIDSSLLAGDGAVQSLFGSPIDWPSDRPTDRWPLYLENPAHV